MFRLCQAKLMLTTDIYVCNDLINVINGNFICKISFVFLSVDGRYMACVSLCRLMLICSPLWSIFVYCIYGELCAQALWCLSAYGELCVQALWGLSVYGELCVQALWCLSVYGELCVQALWCLSVYGELCVQALWWLSAYGDLSCETLDDVWL